eukprot:g34238.t1
MGVKEMVEELIQYLASVSTMEDTSIIPELQESQGAGGCVVAITKEKVLAKLKGLKVDKSPRLDRLHAWVLREVAEEIVEALVVICQDSLESGRVPEDWKMANGFYDCKVVRLTSVISKILDSTIKDEIAEYLEVH